MVRIGEYVGREPVTSTVVRILVQTNVARDALYAGTIIPQYISPGVTGMREAHPS